MRLRLYFSIVIILFNLKMVIMSQTLIEIKVNNLPDIPKFKEGTEVALYGTMNKWNNQNTIAEVKNNTLYYFIVTTTPKTLSDEYFDKPEGANCAFRFVVPGSTDFNDVLIRTNYSTNNRDFRFCLIPNGGNKIVIDASNPNSVDQNYDVVFNGKQPEKPITIDPKKFTFPNGKRKCLIMSYDDGIEFDRTLVEKFNQYGIVGTFHLNSGKFRQKADWLSEKLDRETYYISKSEVRELYKGHEVSGHTIQHRNLAGLDYKSAKSDVKKDIDNLNKLLKKEDITVQGMSFPFGTYDKNTLKVLNELGLKYSRTVVATKNFKLPVGSFLKFDPCCHTYEALEYGKKFITEDDTEMRLLFIWGHSYEFYDNWELADSIGQLLGNRDDIWYAQAIEVVDYLNAIKNLEFKEKKVYNPSKDTSVWMVKDDGEIVELEPGYEIYE